MGFGTHVFFVTCAKGTEGPLRKELVALRIRGAKGSQGGVSFLGTLSDAFKACLHSRVAMRVLLQLAEAQVTDADSLYELTQSVDWSEFMARDTTIAVRAVSKENENLHHAGFVALRIKDAIVDSLRDRHGWRPNVDPTSPDVSVFFHLHGDSARLYLDLSGSPLHRRGYRVAMVPAPLKESLGAAILSLAGVSLDRPFWDPMTGSGTFAIEHAQIGRNIAPGRGRKHAFEHWIGEEYRRIWQTLKQQAAAAELPRCPVKIVARDIDPTALVAAQKNARAAGVFEDMVFECSDITQLALPNAPGYLGINPPYGQRLPAPSAGPSALASLFRHVVAQAGGWRIFLLAGAPEIAAAFPLRPVISHRLWNGPIESRLLVYDVA